MNTRLGKSFRIVGHAGAGGHAPANTLASFQKGIELGANMLEADVHLSRDGELIVIHDATLEHTTNGQGYVHEHTLHELKDLEVKTASEHYQHERIPSLQDVVDLVCGKVELAIDIKNGPILYPEIEQKVVRSLEKNALVDHTTVISFYHRSLQRIKVLNPEINTGIIYNAGLVEPWIAAEAVGADMLYPKYVYPMDDVVAEAHKRGYPVNPWTIDTADEIRQWIRYGVDGITSNYPDIVWGVVQEML